MEITTLLPLNIANDYDGAWKTILDRYFPCFVHLFLPDLYNRISWKRAYISLDKELQKLAHRGDKGKKVVDKLFKVWLLNENQSALIHIEIQTQKDETLPGRMFTTYYRLSDFKGEPILCMVILGDVSSKWRPSSYLHEWEGTKICFDFVAIKLLDYEMPDIDFTPGLNPALILVQAHLQSLKTSHNYQRRLTAKIALSLALYKAGLKQDEFLELMNFSNHSAHS